MAQDSSSTLSDAERERARRTLLWDGVFARLMDTLTGGVFLAGLGLYLGANNFTIGLLASLPFFAQVAQLPTVKLLLHIQDRRSIVVGVTAAARALVVLLGALVLLKGAALGARTLILFMATLAILAVIATAAWNWWVRDVIPRDELGRYFSRRMRFTTLAAAAVLLVAGALLDHYESRGLAAQGYALLFVLGGACGLVSTAFLAFTPHPKPAPVTARGSVLALMASTLREKPNVRLVSALALVSATMSIALPFTAVYMLRSLGYNFVAVTGLALVSQLAYVGGLRGWGHLSDRFGNRPTLQISLGILVVSLLGWSIAWSNHGAGLFALLLALHFLSGFAIGGVELTYANILLKSAPEANAPAYLAAMGLTRAFVGGVAAVVAGAAWQVMGTEAILTLHPLPRVEWSLRGFHFLTLASAVTGLLALLGLARVAEEGGRPVQEVAIAMRREVRQMSSVAGIRGFVHVVSFVVEFLAGGAEEEKKEAAPQPAVEGASVQDH